MIEITTAIELKGHQEEISEILTLHGIGVIRVIHITESLPEDRQMGGHTDTCTDIRQLDRRNFPHSIGLCRLWCHFPNRQSAQFCSSAVSSIRYVHSMGWTNKKMDQQNNGPKNRRTNWWMNLRLIEFAYLIYKATQLFMVMGMTRQRKFLSRQNMLICWRSLLFTWRYDSFYRCFKSRGKGRSLTHTWEFPFTIFMKI